MGGFMTLVPHTDAYANLGVDCRANPQVLHQSPLSGHCLRRLLEQSSQLLRTLTTAQVRHTLRAGNTMADYLVNMAMNTKLSHRSDSNWSSTDEHLTRLVSNDTAHPHTDVTVKSTADLLDLTRRHIQHYEVDDASAGGQKPAR